MGRMKELIHAKAEEIALRSTVFIMENSHLLYKRRSGLLLSKKQQIT